MKNSIKFFAVIFYLILVMQVRCAFATHAAGAEISYVCLGSGRYEITYIFYRDCIGITPNTSIDIQITNDCGYPTQTVLLYQLGMEVEIETVCPGPFTTCNGGNYIGIQKFVYRGIVNLPAECTWYVAHSEPARNAAISTITGAGVDILYVYCMINTNSGICNNSPEFYEDPILSFCVGQELFIELPVRDMDNDSLSFELITPRTGPGLYDTVTFLPGYSATQPFLCSLPMTFDPIRGVFRGIPSANDVSIYAMAVNEYRNGILIGQIERDIMLTAGNCSNNIPVMTGFNGLPNYSMNVISNQSNCFYVASIDPDVSNQTIIEYEDSISGMSLFNSGGQRDSIFFCWTPSLADTAQNPHSFRLKVMDGNCPYLGIYARNYYLNVRNAVGINDISENNFAIWPNPFSSEISLSSAFTGKVELNLFDIQGRQVMNSIITDSNGPVKINSVDAGIYLLSIKSLNSGRNLWKRIIKD